MMIGYLLVVEDSLRFGQRFSTDGFNMLGIWAHAGEGGFIECVHYLRAFGVDVVGEELRIDAGVGGYFLFVERLNEV